MKKYVAALVVVCMLFSVVTLHYQQKAHAEVMTAAIIGAAAVAIGASLGMAITGVGSTWIPSQVDNYCSGQSISEVFGSEVIRSIAGRLVVPAAMYNAILDFLSWLRGETEVEEDGDTFEVSLLDGCPLNVLVPYWTLGGWQGLAGTQEEGNGGRNYYAHFVVQGINGLEYEYSSQSWPKSADARPLGYIITYDPETATTNFHFAMKYKRLVSGVWTEGNVSGRSVQFLTTPQVDDLTIEQTGQYDPLEVVEGEDWQGDLGYPTNIFLDDVVDMIYDDIVEGPLEVEAEVIPDTPPTPAPTTPPAEDILEGINDLINQQDTVIEGINDLIDQGDQITDSINDLIDQGETVIEGVNDLIGQNDQIIEGINDLVENTDGITDAIDDVATDVAEIAETLDETAEVIQEATEVVDPADAADYKFDLRNLFPFCIPFDVVRILNLFDVSPVAPRVQLPFVIDSLDFSYTFDLDFSAFNSVAAIMRGLEFIVFAIGLAIVTSKVIRW